MPGDHLVDEFRDTRQGGGSDWKRQAPAAQNVDDFMGRIQQVLKTQRAKAEYARKGAELAAANGFSLEQRSYTEAAAALTCGCSTDAVTTGKFRAHLAERFISWTNPHNIIP
jgi:hypothetical protein